MADVAALVERELSAGERRRASSIADLWQPGLSRRENLSAVARTLSGSSSGAAYRNARKAAARWFPVDGVGAHASARYERLLSRRQSEGSERLRSFRAHGCWMKLRVAWYARRKPEWLPPHRWIHIRQSELRQVIYLWEDGEAGTAAELLVHEFYEQYAIGEANILDWERDVTVLDMRLEEGIS